MREIRFPISAKITLLFLMLSILMIGAISFIDFTYTKGDLEKRILTDLVAVSNAKATTIKTLVEEDFEDVRDVANRVMIKNPLAKIAAGSGEITALKAQIFTGVESAEESSKTIENVTIIGMDGKVLVSTSPGITGDDFSESVFFINGKKDIYLGLPFMYRGKFVYEMSAPIVNTEQGGNEVVGVARVMIDQTRLYNILRDYSGLGNTGETVLGKRRGDDILFIGPLREQHNRKSKLRIPIKSKLAIPMRAAINKKTGFGVGLDYRGIEVLTAYYYIPISDWGLVVKIDKKEAFKPIDDLRLQMILFSCLLFLMSALAVMSVVRYITEPINTLREGTRVVAEGDLGYRVEVNTKDEIGDLAASFNEMTAHLKKITVSVDRLNKEIDDRKAAEEKLSEALKVKSGFIQTVSHELRTPLAAVREGINIVLDGILGKVNDEQRDFLTKTKTNVERLTRLINEILDFQKLESGKMTLTIEDNDINKIVRDVYDIMEPLAKQKNLNFTLAVDPGLPIMRFDKDRIAQVLTNLIANAIKFTDTGNISISTLLDNDRVHIAVMDTGRGISSDDMPRLFKSFEQLGRPRDRRGGTGLGLIISKDIVELHQGSMWAESEIGKGSTFYITLPIIRNVL